MGNLMNPVNHNMATMGQFGSVIVSASAAATVAPTGKVFVAITMLTDCKFDTQTGASDDGGLVAEDETLWANTNLANTGSGTNGQIVTDSTTFPKGVTIYGRYTEIDLNTGTCIAYVG